MAGTNQRRPLLLVVLVSVLVAAATRADDNSTAGASVTFPLPSNCTTSCGNITFEYPFGVGHGCFRPGFDLICNTTTDPPRLFLGNTSGAIEVVDKIDIRSYLTVKALVAVMDVNDNSTYTSWAALANSPFFFESGSAYLSVAGCSAAASLVDLVSNQTLATCNTTCAQPSCYVKIERDMRSFGILLSRSNHTREDNASLVNATISLGPPWEGQLSLSWGIQPTCKEAVKQNMSYACLSPSSFCVDNAISSSSSISYGYWCKCQNDSVGNPYVPTGCPNDDPLLDVIPIVNVIPSSNCERRCGNGSIPFPFGLEVGCYRGPSFALSCNQNSNPPALLFNVSDTDIAQVSNILLEEGQMEVSVEGNANSEQYRVGGRAWRKPFMFLQDRAILKWAVDYETCDVAKQNSSKFACRAADSKCVDTNITTYSGRLRMGYICKCPDGFEGNPYLSDGDGCKDIDECKNPKKYGCYGRCVNTVGSYKCTSTLLLGAIIGVIIGLGTLLLVITTLFAAWKWKKIRDKRIRQKHFKENHGLLLEQLIASHEDNVERIKIFSLKELEKATNNFDSSRILGQGAHGTVYKGILSDQRVVAIKRSKIKEKSEIDDFLNEITILSQINHRNVVKLFGCCLETEVPLLVYEFISNGTLFHHLHNQNRKSTLSWGDRLRIAAEVAGALEYLHSSASVSIFHRDMKSSNILLDDYYIAKVSDFGASRLIPLDQTHIFTGIQGTLGYLDPEYHQTWQLTEKSDVYSFGVILLELLTGEKPILSVQNEEERNLIMQFLEALKDNRHFELIENRVMVEGMKEDLDKVSRLAEMCLKLKGSERPTMREVEIQLRCLQKVNTKEKRISQADKEIVPNLFQDIWCPQSQGTSNYSLEMEFISSMRQPR